MHSVAYVRSILKWATSQLSTKLMINYF